MTHSFPHYTQLDAMDCGPTCLRMVAKHYGRSYTLQNLRERSFITREGVSMLGISDAAESIGFHTQGVKITLEQLIEDAPLPCILHWNQNHFVVLYKISRKKRFRHCEGYRPKQSNWGCLESKSASFFGEVGLSGMPIDCQEKFL